MKKITSMIMITLMIVAVQATVFASDDNSYRSKFYGTIEELPAGLNGTWVVNGRSVEVTPQTRIEQKHGQIAVGTYVEINGRSDGRTFTAHKVEVKRWASDSGHDGDDSRRHVTGKDELHSGIQRLPHAEAEI
jgi:translation elongation factor EF-Tu-like GTPase